MRLFQHEGVLRSLRRAAGAESPDPAFLEDSVLQTIQGANTEDPPWHWKRGFTRFASAPATAGQYSSIVLWVPDEESYDSVVYVVRSIYVFTAVASYVHIDPGLLPSLRGYPVLPAGGLSPISWDQGGRNAAATKVGPPHYSPHVNVNSPDWWGQALALAANVGQYAHPQPIVLRRGAYVEVSQNTPNLYIAASMYWDVYDMAR